MKINRKNKTKIILAISWLALIILGLILFSSGKEKILEDELVDPIPRTEDRNNYNFSVNATVESEYSPLYQCKSNTIPEYLNSFAQEIDGNLEREEGPSLIRWINQESENVLVYNIDSTTLNIYLESYPEKISFSSVDNFVSTYLSSSIEYSELQVQVEEDTELYSANRILDEEELIKGYGYSDYYYVENGYLTNARVLLAEFSKSEYVVPLINNVGLIERYINLKEYPKDVIVHTSDIIQLTPDNYEEGYSLEFKYEKCIVNSIEPKLYFSSCNYNYIYYSYKIDGTCDLTYENQLYSVPFQGFINALDLEYVKSTE